MSRTYKATGINLKSAPIGEADRLLTILTQQFGLIRVVAKGARKHLSKFGGRGELFVVNRLLIARGRSLDKIAQAETVVSYPGLSRDLGKLAAGQYLAELVLFQALSEQPQEELFAALNEHLRRLEGLPRREGRAQGVAIAAYLVQGTFHLLALAGLAPQVQVCSLCRVPIEPNFELPGWYAGFSAASGGAIAPQELDRLAAAGKLPSWPQRLSSGSRMCSRSVAEMADSAYDSAYPSAAIASPASGYPSPRLRQQAGKSPGQPRLEHQRLFQVNAMELSVLQQLAQSAPVLTGELSETLSGEQLGELSMAANDCKLSISDSTWFNLERLLRQYAQYHFGRPIRSADLIDTCLMSG